MVPDPMSYGGTGLIGSRGPLSQGFLLRLVLGQNPDCIPAAKATGVIVQVGDMITLSLHIPQLSFT